MILFQVDCFHSAINRLWEIVLWCPCLHRQLSCPRCSQRFESPGSLSQKIEPWKINEHGFSILHSIEMMWMNSQVWPLRTTAAYSTFRVQEPLPSFVISRAIPYPTVVAMAMVPWSHGCHHLARPGLSVNKSWVYLGTRNPSDAHPTRGYISYVYILVRISGIWKSECSYVAENSLCVLSHSAKGL